MSTAALRVTTWVPVVGFAGALAALLLAPGLVTVEGEGRSGIGLVRGAATGALPWGDPRVVALLVACGAAVRGLLARGAPALARLLALVGLLAATAFHARAGAGATVPGYAALAGFAIAFLGSRSPGCGPLG
jgi:hypothetical protein